MPADPLTSIDALIAERHLLKHPFYVAWREGTLTTGALRTYAAQYYRHVRAFPTFISALHSRCEDMETRQALLRNLRDEEEGADNHAALWLRFAAAVGCDAAEADGAPEEQETSAALAAFRAAMTEGTPTRGLAALYAYEAMVPAVAAEKIHGLAAHYGVTGPPGTDYFEVHRTLDLEHAGETRALLAARLAAQGEAAAGEAAAEAAEAATGAGAALDAINALLDGVCRLHGIGRAA